MSMRLLVVMIVAAGCGGDDGPAPAASDAGADSDAAVDAGRVERDGGRRDAGRAPDAGRDAGELDAGVDAGLAPTDAGPCTHLPQSGCPEGTACRVQHDSDGRLAGTACEPAGPDSDGEMCTTYDAGGDSCLPGLDCYYWCRPYCVPGAMDCPRDPTTGRARVCEDATLTCIVPAP